GSSRLGPIFAALATTGVILAAVYLLYMWNKVFMGEYRRPAVEAGHGGGGPDHEPTDEVSGHEHGVAEIHSSDPYPPLRWNETLALVIVVIAAIIIGIFPKPFFNY